MVSLFNAGIDDLNDVITRLEKTGFPYDQWKRLGLVIGISYNELDCVRAEHKNPKNCLMECLSLWLQQKYDTDKYSLPSMESLANATQTIGLRAVSSGIKKGIAMNNNYCIINLNVSVALPSQANETIIHYVDPDISKSLKVLHSTFAALIAKMRRRLADYIKNQKIELIDIARFVEEYLGIRDLTNAESIDDLFNRIQGYYYYLNCPVIECITIEFLISNGLQEKMRNYLLELESFKSTKLSDLLSAIRTALQPLPISSSSNPTASSTAIKFVLKFNSQWENQTIKALELFLSYHFNRSDLFNYIQMDYGCLCITFQVPYSHFQYLIDVVTPKLKAMRRMGVLQLVINDNVLIDEKDTVSDDELSIEEVQSGQMSLAMSLGEGDKMKSIESQGNMLDNMLWVVSSYTMH